MSVECGSCGKHLSEDFAGMPRQPCPNCGATARVLSASAQGHRFIGRRLRTRLPLGSWFAYPTLSDTTYTAGVKPVRNGGSDHRPVGPRRWRRR